MTDDNFFDIDTQFDDLNHNVPVIVRYHNAATALEHAKKQMISAFDTDDERKVLERILDRCRKMIKFHNRERNKLYTITSPVTTRLKALDAVSKSIHYIEVMSNDITVHDDGDGD